MAYKTDNDVWKILFNLLNLWSQEFLVKFGTDVTILRSYQPQQVYVPTGLAVFIHKIHSKRYGWQSYHDHYNTLTTKNDHVERYILNNIYQISSQDTTDASQDDSIRSIDALQDVSAFLQSFRVIELMKASELEIFRISNIKNDHFSNDFKRFEPTPSFDFMISYTQDLDTEEEPVTNIEGITYPV